MNAPEVESVLTELLRNLSEEIEVQNSIHECLVRESEALIQGDLEALRRVVDDLEPRIARRASLAEDREALRRALAEALSAEPADVTLTRVIAAAPERMRDRLRELRNALGRAVAAVADANRTASRLLYPSLQVTRAFLRALSGGKGSPAYGASGQESSSEPRPFFERRA